MRVYLVRHGDALSTHPSGDRPLSDKGVLEVERMAEFLAMAGVEVGEIVHSGKARAEQTAQALHRGVGVASPLTVWEGLRPNDPVEPIVARVRRAGTDIMIVGHLPFLPSLAAYLLCGEARSVFAMHTGAAACLRRAAPDTWRIEWLLYPALVKAR